MKDEVCKECEYLEEGVCTVPKELEAGKCLILWDKNMRSGGITCR